MNVQIDAAIKRARGYWLVDGFIEIAAGGLLVILAGFLLFSLKTSQAPFPSWFLSITGEVSIIKIVSFLIIVLALWWLKDHFTYPRTGFVRGKITTTQILSFIRNVFFFLLLPLAGLLMVSLLITSTADVISSMPIWFPIGLALLWAIFIILAGEWMGIIRFRLVGGLILLAGIGIGIWQLTAGLPNIRTNLPLELLQQPVIESVNRTLISLSILLLSAGAIFICSGILTFLHYRRENPQPYAEDV